MTSDITQKRIKVLWFCNCPLMDKDPMSTGSWLGAMAQGLISSASVELGIITFGPVTKFTRKDYYHVNQWLVPVSAKTGKNGLISENLVSSIIAAVTKFKPDLVHVWGVEYFWGLLTARKLVKTPALLEMQGMKGVWAKEYSGRLTLSEQVSTLGVKELLKLLLNKSDKITFERWGKFENEIIRAHKFIDIQSEWIGAQVKSVNPHAKLYNIDLALRPQFLRPLSAWDSNIPKSAIFCCQAYAVPHKGLHVTIRAFSQLKSKFQHLRLRVAGNLEPLELKQTGYGRWILWLVQRLNLTDSIDWLGAIDADSISAEMKSASAMVISSFIENCCTTMQEAMAIGTPTVVSYAGGMPSLAKDEESCLFFPPGDDIMCAYQLERILTNKELATKLSVESRKIAFVRSNPDRIVCRQLEIYHQVLSECI